ncbi:MAG: hypothetical protein ABGW98_06445, partial [Myxococcales bacterium]
RVPRNIEVGDGVHHEGHGELLGRHVELPYSVLLGLCEDLVVCGQSKSAFARKPLRAWAWIKSCRVHKSPTGRVERRTPSDQRSNL